ncbi:hypothetical protein V5799_018426 [Amblyomma americanum]|uniref:RNA-directed DNA polymerase n=1 Tax=Amblyomma americanum TaxID=6943 RepID=A0AAQ4F042_AMBAM
MTSPTTPSTTAPNTSPTSCQRIVSAAEILVAADIYDVSALVDTGADFSVMSSHLATALRKALTPWHGPHIRTAGGHVVTPVGIGTCRIKIRGATFIGSFAVLRECSKELILGVDFLKEYGAVVNLHEQLVSFLTQRAVATDPEPHRAALRISDDHTTIPPRASKFVTVKCDTSFGTRGIAETNLSLLLSRQVCVARALVDLVHARTELLVTNFSSEPQHLTKNTVIAHLEELGEHAVQCALSTTDPGTAEQDTAPAITIDLNPDLLINQKRHVESLIDSFRDCLASTSKVLQTPITKHRIIVDSDQRPLCQRPYRVSSNERDAIRRQVAEMLRDDVIQPSTSPWASPVVLVAKKRASLRFCLDYRRLNNVTERDVYPLPRIDDSLDRLRHATYFSSLDLRSGYRQIEVDERDREKTAFVTPDGLYEFKVLPFGLCSAPATFQRMMDTVLTDLKWQSCLVYLDDVVIFSDTFEDHLKRLRAVFEAIRSAGLSLKSEKCHFAFRELKFLGHIVSAQGVSTDPEKTAAVAAFYQPTDKRRLRRFLGLCAYYRRFVENFSKLAEPLTRLTKDSEPVFWGQDQETAFTELKARFQSTPILGHFDEKAATELHTDVSNVGLGAVLVQWQDGVERVLAYASRTLSRAEMNYSTAEKECLAVVWAITKFRPYLYGHPFRVVSDHHSLCWLANLKDPSGRLARWDLRLQEFNVTIVHKSGQQHSDADCLSRAPLPCPPDEPDGDSAFLGVVTTSDLARHQRADCELLPLIEYLEGTAPSPPRLFSRGLSSFCLIDEVLYKKNYGPTETAYLLVAPTALRQEVLAACHDDLSSGHLDFSRTLGRLRHRYYWPRLAAVVQRCVRTCSDCQRRKIPPTKPAGLLKPIDPPQIPFQQVGMDLLGPFPVSSMGNRYIVVATDYLSRYCETKALPRGTAAEIAQFFVHHIVLRHGAPVVVLTHRGTAFTSALTHEVLRLSGTSHRKTTAYHPQTNGLTERLNKTIADMMSYVCRR